MKVQRNDPCPCGSGKKYKKCCGPTGTSFASQAKNTHSKPRPCGECAACCQGWLTTQVLQHEIRLGNPCPHTDGKCCKIHAKRPEQPCRVFHCGWAMSNSDLPEWMLPSRSGVIVLSGRLTWRKHAVDVLVSAGKDPDAKLLAWYQQYSIKDYRPFVYQQQEQWFGFGPEAFQADIAAKVARGEALWDGSMDRF